MNIRNRCLLKDTLLYADQTDRQDVKEKRKCIIHTIVQQISSDVIDAKFLLSKMRLMVQISKNIQGDKKGLFTNNNY